MKKIIKLLLSVVFVLGLSTQANAKDLYVATTGDDSVTYANNDITHPWRSVTHAWGSVRANDTVYYRAGTYNILSTISYINRGEHVTHTNYNDEVVLWNSDLTSDCTFDIQTNYLTIDGINGDQAEFTGGSGDGFFEVGYNGSAHHFTLRNSIGLFGGNTGDNAGYIFAGSQANYLVIENNTILGTQTDGRSPGASCIWIDRSEHAIIKNNELGNMEMGIYFKHSNSRTGNGGLIENNYIHDCGTAGIHNTHNHTVVKNNLLVNADIDTAYDGGPGNGGTGGDFNLYDHNTFYQGDDHANWASICQTSSGANDAGATDNTLNNNVWINAMMGPEYESPSCTEDMRLSSDYNLYSRYKYRSSSKNLSEVQALWGGDSHSLFNKAVIVGGDSPSAITDYALTSTSPGYQAAANGSDLGANMALVGPSNSGSTDTTAPTLSEITPVPTPTTTPTPSYTFSSNKAGDITYGGDCSSATTSAVSGNNNITLDTLTDGTYSNCTITVTDSSNNSSAPLSITSFTIDSSAVVIRSDVDQQDGTTIDDALLTLRNSLGLDMSTTSWRTSATTGDVNCNGISNSTDALLILRDVRGLSMSGTGWCVDD